jgi:hypothetical protein
MAFIAIIAGLFTVNLILIRNCSIFVSVKFYPAICNYSLFKKLNGKFEFTRDVPLALPFRNSTNFESPRRSHNAKKVSKRNGSVEVELEALNKGSEENGNSKGNEKEIEIVVNR